NGSNEVAWDKLRALVDELIEGVLPVGAWLTPDDGAGRDVYHFAVTVNVLAVTLHVTLLKVSGETVHVLIIWQNSLRLSTKEIVVPDAQQSQSRRQVLLKGGSPAVLRHLMTAAEQFLDVVERYA